MYIYHRLAKMWIGFVFLVTFVSCLVYIVAQQVVRLGANEELVALTTNARLEMEHGLALQDALLPDPVVRGVQGLDPFVMIFSADKRLVANNIKDAEPVPVYPAGVLDYVAAHGESRVTWKPANGIRYASVAIKAPNGSGYIVAARSLAERERLIGEIGQIVLLAWLVAVVGTKVLMLLVYLMMRKKKE